MRLWLNDTLLELAGPIALSQFLMEVLQQQGTYAVALNHHFIPRHAYETTALAEDDRLDIIIPMQGG
jgi:sulfur carrier protein